MIIFLFQGAVVQDFVPVVSLDIALTLLFISLLLGILVVFNRPPGLVLPTTDDKKTPR